MNYKEAMVAILGAKLGSLVADSVTADNLPVADLDTLCGAKGAAKVRAAMALGVHLRKRYSAPISSSRMVLAQCADMATLREEHVVALLCDARQHVMRRVTVSMGSPNACTVEPRMILAPALRLGAASIILVHNHPSGDPSPSSEDLALTEAVREACRLLGCPLLDHVIIADGGSFSFLDAGLLTDAKAKCVG